MANWHLAKTKAKEIREKYRLNTPPVNVFEIAAKENITISYFKPDDSTNDIAGFLMKDQRKIYLNPNDSAQRQNFTLAHELAHYFLEHKPSEYGVNWRNSQYTVKPEAEKEADAFAAELLMPKEAIVEIKKKYSLTDSDAAILSKLFGVSPMAMKARLRSIQHESDT